MGCISIDWWIAGRPLRPTSADVVCHVLNRANARPNLLEHDGDYGLITIAHTKEEGVDRMPKLAGKEMKL